ncbi:3'-5' exonuclease [Parabacteroides sp. AD58]|uniref:DNA 3'-5' helicase II n=1 Tax=Parabacteroides absconsus TaxID=2951805 RepID=A0ABZ2IR73_9BACT|nr:3'-5' exonuclease [Parabacteroides sp. AD58]MCM6903688.1 ATP-binding domain-containing protein [Parabacteroides sp. AD58]
MRLEKWFISNLDDSQRNIIVQSIDKSIVVRGSAGSGKTNLAIHRALQAKNKGTYAIIIFTIALKRMIAYGMEVLGLDKERIAYEWAWTNRGFDMTGDVYWKKGDGNYLYLVNDTEVRKFKRCEKNSKAYGLDFADWVAYKFYSAFGRRVSWFNEVAYDNKFSVTDTDYELIPSGTMYKQCENIIDYLIIDEAQDFNISDYKLRIVPKAGVSLSLFGDSAQQMNSNGSNIEDIAIALDYDRLSLDYNYRLPKSIAKVAQQIQNTNVDLMTNNKKDGGNSDYPNYPKPVIAKYNNREEELHGILSKIQMEDLDDVAILVPTESDVMEVNKFLNDNGVNTQVHYRTGKVVPFNTINTLDFSNNDLPCILTYYAAKGSEFDNVFVPFANAANTMSRNSFYVACTRSSRNLYISYSGKRTPYLENVSKEFVTEIDYTKQS